MRKLASLLITTTLLISATSSAAFADDWRGHGDIHGFHDHDFNHWRSGRWFNGFHEGRSGWWWIVDGLWYFYPAPIYPYPDPYTPPTVVVETAPVAPTGAQPSYVYYCTNPAGYYPYVPQCTVTWQKVASASATPPQPQAIVTPVPQPAPAPQAMPSATNPHDIDTQQLNVFSARLQSIDPNDPHARAKLKELAAQVETFRQSLYKKDYNAMDVLKNADDLKVRIAAERSSLGKNKDALSPVAPATNPVPLPTSLAAGDNHTLPTRNSKSTSTEKEERFMKNPSN